MSDETQSNLPYAVLTNEDCVYRILTNAKGYDRTSGNPLSGGFRRRPPLEDGTLRDEKGLSVCPADTVSASALIERWKPKAIVSLIVGDIRSVETEPNLDVVKDAPSHANLTGLPADGEDDDKAELLATLLARMCRRVYPP